MTINNQSDTDFTADTLDSNLNTTSTAPLSRLATMFRQLGIVAVVLSAVIYMLQGFDNISLDFRQWTWPILMVVMGVGGVVCRSFFDDVKSARIFFILSAALVTVQFSQLGGMLHDSFAPNVSSQAYSWGEAIKNNVLLITNVFVSIGLSMFLVYTCFSILVRKSSLILMSAFLFLNILMLLPMRASYGAVIVIALMILTIMWLQTNIFKSNSAFRTREGITLRLLVLLPMIISMVRNSFHIDSIIGIGLCGTMAAFFIMYCLPAWFAGPFLKEICLRLGALLAALGWFMVTINMSTSIALIYFLPLIGLSFELSRRSSTDKSLYRTLGCVVFTGLSIFICLPGESLMAVLIIMMTGLTILSSGVMLNLKAPIFAGIVCSVIALVTLLCLSLSSVSINIWLSLAVGGGLLVLLSSVVEKYGRLGLQYFQQVKAFD